MLKNLQGKRLKKIVFWVLISVIMPGFIIWGFSSSLRSDKKSRSSLMLFNRPISQDDYLQAVRATEMRLLMQFGEENYAQLKKFFDLKMLALQRLAMLAEADKRRIRVSDTELVEFIQRSPMFQSKGRFDNSVYEQFLTYALNMKPRMFEEITRQDLKIQRLVESLTKDITVSDAEIREAYRRENEQLSLYYAAAVPADFSSLIIPQAGQLEEYFKAHSAEFKKPLSFNLEYLPLDSGFQAKTLRERLENGETLEAVAKGSNLTIRETGLFEQNAPLPGIGWSSEAFRELEQSYIKQVLGPVEIEKKFYIFRVKERKEPFLPEFKDVTELVRTNFIKAESRRIAREKIDALHAKLVAAQAKDPGSSADLEKAAKEMSLKFSSTALFSSGSYIEGIGASDAFSAAGSKLAEGAVSGVIELPSGFYIVKLKDQPVFDENKFAQDREKFSLKVLNEKKDAFLSKFSEELMKKALNLPQLPVAQPAQQVIPMMPEPEPEGE